MLDKTKLTKTEIEYVNSLENKAQAFEVLENKIKTLEEQISKMQKMIFGQKSEKTKYIEEETEQLSLFNEAEENTNKQATEPTEETVKEYIRAKKRTKEEIFGDLPTETLEYDLSDEEKAEYAKHGNLEKIGSEYVIVN